MKAKKVYAFVLAAVMVFGTAGCGNAAETNGASQGSAAAKESESEKNGEQTENQTEAEAGDNQTSVEETGEDNSENSESKEDTMGGENSIVEVPEWDAVDIPDNEALAFVEDMQLGWNLGNTFDASNCGLSDDLEYESAWVGIVTTKEMIHTIADAGFKTIRIPVK